SAARISGRVFNWVFAVLVFTLVSAPVVMRAAQQLEDRDAPSREGRDGRNGDDESPIRHVVVIFQENVSFDHYFATYPNAANTDGSPFVAKPGTPLVNGLFPGGLLDHNPNSTQPFRLSASQAVTCDQGHGYKQEQQSYAAGSMNRFPETVG